MNPSEMKEPSWLCLTNNVWPVIVNLTIGILFKRFLTNNTIYQDNIFQQQDQKAAFPLNKSSRIAGKVTATLD